MKKIIALIFLLAAIIAVQAYFSNPYEFSFPATGATNTVLIDVGNTSQVGLNIYYTATSGTGNLILVCSNSFDGQRWYYDAAHSLSFPLGVGTTNYTTNWGSIGSFQYWQYTVQNAAGNNAAIPYFNLTFAKKDGL